MIPLVLLSVFMPIPGCFQYCSSVVEFEVRDCDDSRSSFIVQDWFGYPGFFAFPYEVDYCSFEVFEGFCWDFAGHCVEEFPFLRYFVYNPPWIQYPTYYCIDLSRMAQ